MLIAAASTAALDLENEGVGQPSSRQDRGVAPPGSLGVAGGGGVVVMEQPGGGEGGVVPMGGGGGGGKEIEDAGGRKMKSLAVLCKK